MPPLMSRVVPAIVSRSFALLFGLLWLASPAVTAAERGALFRITLDGHEMHLFGTLHVGLPGFYPLEPRIAEALAQSSTLALEIDPARRVLLERLVAEGGLDSAKAWTFKPVLLATLLALAEYTRQGYRSQLSSEAWLARQARAKGTRILELESLDRQLSLLDRLGEPERWRFLDETMGTIVSGAQRREARAMVQAWSSADRAALDAIAARCDADASVSGKFVNQVLLKERNAGLAEGLLHLLRQERTTFAAVGVLHLLGNGSVTALLREQGAQVERIY